MSIMHRALAPLLTLATSIALAYTLFGLGFVVCTTPQATAAIGGHLLWLGEFGVPRRRHGGHR